MKIRDRETQRGDRGMVRFVCGKWKWGTEFSFNNVLLHKTYIFVQALYWQPRILNECMHQTLNIHAYNTKEDSKFQSSRSNAMPTVKIYTDLRIIYKLIQENWKMRREDLNESTLHVCCLIGNCVWCNRYYEKQTKTFHWSQRKELHK